MVDESSEVTLNAFGKTVSIKGLGTIFIVIVVLFAGGLGFMLYDLSQAATKAVQAAVEGQRQSIVEHKAIVDASAAIKDNQTVILEGVKKVDGSIKTQNYILLADPIEKADIKRRMSMPKELHDLGVRER